MSLEGEAGTGLLEKTPDTTRPAYRYLALLLCLGLFGFSVGPRISGLEDPYWTATDFCSAQFAVYARNYLRYGFPNGEILSSFSFVGGIPIVSGRPPGGSILLALWSSVWGLSESSSHSLSFVINILTVASIYQICMRLWNFRTAMIASLLFWNSPLAIYFSHTYQIECPMLLSSLVTVWSLIRYEQTGRWVFLWGGLTSAFVATLLDVYVFGQMLVFGFWAFSSRRRKESLMLAISMALGFAVTASLVFLTKDSSRLRLEMSTHSPGLHNVSLEILLHSIKELSANCGYIPLLLAALCLWRMSELKGESKWLWLIASVPLATSTVFVETLRRHDFLFIIFLPTITILGSNAAAKLKDRWVALLLASQCFLGVAKTTELFTPVYKGDIETAKFIRSHTKDEDLLIGLPPHLAYYVDRPATLRYNYFWAPPGTYPNQESFFKQLEGWGQLQDYSRVVLFTQFVSYENYPMDFSRAFDSNPGLTRKTKPGEDPQVWVRRRQ